MQPVPLTFRAIRGLGSKASEPALQVSNGSEGEGNRVHYTGAQVRAKLNVLPPPKNATDSISELNGLDGQSNHPERLIYLTLSCVAYFILTEKLLGERVAPLSPKSAEV